MKAESITALATVALTFITLIASMFGFYYNLQIQQVPLLNIVLFELLFVTAFALCLWWVKQRGELP